MSIPATAPDLETLYDFETHIEEACDARLVALGVNRAQVSQGTDDQASGRVEIELVMGAHRPGNYHIPANLPDGEVDTRACFEDSWSAVLNFAVITNRDKPAQNHKAQRRKVRALMVRFFSEFPEDLLPFHEVSMATTAGTTPGLMREQHEDVTKLHYNCVISIRPYAWPAPYGTPYPEDDGD